MRFAALALSIVTLVGQLSSFAHALFVPHASCAEHGEVIHAPQGPANPGATAGSPELAFAAAPVVDADHAHEHCLFASVCRDHPTLSPRLCDKLDRPVSSPSRVQPRDIEPACAVALFRLAPKSSPPA